MFTWVSIEDACWPYYTGLLIELYMKLFPSARLVRFILFLLECFLRVGLNSYQIDVYNNTTYA